MPDGAVISTAPLTVATKEDAAKVHHQRVVTEILSAGIPQDVTAANPCPIVDETANVILQAILTELRVQNELIFQLVNPPSETLDSMRLAAGVVPIS